MSVYNNSSPSSREPEVLHLAPDGKASGGYPTLRPVSMCFAFDRPVGAVSFSFALFLHLAAASRRTTDGRQPA